MISRPRVNDGRSLAPRWTSIHLSPSELGALCRCLDGVYSGLRCMESGKRQIVEALAGDLEPSCCQGGARSNSVWLLSRIVSISPFSTRGLALLALNLTLGEIRSGVIFAFLMDGWMEGWMEGWTRGGALILYR